MKTILVITPYLPYRNVAHAGGKVMYEFIVQLKQRGFRVCLAALLWPEEANQLESLKLLCDDTYFLISIPVFTDTLLNSFQMNPLRFVPKVLKGIRKHFAIRAQFNAGIHRLLLQHDPDVIQVEYSTMVLYLGRLRSAEVRVLHLHDLMIKPLKRLCIAESKAYARATRFMFFGLVKYLELYFCRCFDLILVKSSCDLELLHRYGNFAAKVFPLGIEPAGETALRYGREPNSVLFVGAMYREVNERAAMFFVEQVMGRLERRIGAVKFYIVGASPSHRIRGLSSDKVIVTGFVEELALYFGRCMTFVAPLFIGGGMIFKVLEAMNHGLPVVCSSIANEGIMAKDGRDLLIANEADGFSAKLASLMTDEQHWNRLAESGRRFVRSRYSWDIVMDDYLKNVNLV